MNHSKKTVRGLALLGVGVATSLLLVNCAGGTTAPAAQETLDLATPVAGEIADGALDGVSLAYAGAGGAIQDAQLTAWWDPFTAASGAEVAQDAYDSGKLKAMVDAGNPSWDIVHTSSLDAGRNCGTLFEKIDTSLVDLSYVPDGTITNECMIPSNTLGMLIAYNTDAFGDNPPTSAADFFDTEKFPGKRGVGMSTYPSPEMFEFAAVAQGKDLADYSAEDVPGGLDMFRDLGDNLVGWTTGAQAQQQLESGEVVMSFTWVSRAHGAAVAGADIAPVWQDWFIMNDAFAIPKGSSQVEAAYAALNYSLGEKVQTEISELTSYGAVNTESAPKLDEVSKAWFVSDHLDSGTTPDESFWLDNYDAFTAEWAAWVTGS